MQSAQPTQFGEMRNEEELSPEVVKSRMSAAEWQKIYEMSMDKNLYSNLCTSLFPSIYGQWAVAYVIQRAQDSIRVNVVDIDVEV